MAVLAQAVYHGAIQRPGGMVELVFRPPLREHAIAVAGLAGPQRGDETEPGCGDRDGRRGALQCAAYRGLPESSGATGSRADAATRPVVIGANRGSESAAALLRQRQNSVGESGVVARSRGGLQAALAAIETVLARQLGGCRRGSEDDGRADQRPGFHRELPFQAAVDGPVAVAIHVCTAATAAL